jgi:hypothetical protein
MVCNKSKESIPCLTLKIEMLDPLDVVKIAARLVNAFSANSHAKVPRRRVSTLCVTQRKNYFVKKGTPGFEPGVKDLQSSALPLGHVPAF